MREVTCHVELVNHTPDPEQSILSAAANCWKSVPHQNILDHIVKAGHLTPLEFATFDFYITGVSRSLLAQLTRKRVGVAFAVESQRYVSYEDGFDYIKPVSINRPFFTRCSKVGVWLSYENMMELIADFYNNMIAHGNIPAEDARFILPNACATSLRITINFHALMDLCAERLCTRAQWEIRDMVMKMAHLVTDVSPRLGNYLNPKCHRLGYCPEGKNCKGWRS